MSCRRTSRFWLGQLLQEAGVEVSGHHPPFGPDALAQPPSHRPGSGPDLETLPVRRQRDPAEPLSGAGVEDLLEQIEPATLLLPGVREEILAHEGQATSGPSGSLPFGVSMAVRKPACDP